MKPLMLTLVAVFLMAAGAAHTLFSGYPPAKYRGDATVTVHMVRDIHPRCGLTPLKPPARFLACHRDGEIVMPNPCSDEFAGQSFAKLLCHELGHHNGWPGDHPDALGRPQGPPMKS